MSPRPQKMPTATVSICVTPDEGGLIRDAAGAAGLTVSAWAASRTILAMASAKARGAVASAARAIEAHPVARGARSGRISMIMRQPDHDSLKEAATALKLTAHAFAQAALLLAAEEDLRDLPAPVRRFNEAQRKAAQRAGSFSVALPATIAPGLDVPAFSEVVRALLTGTLRQVLDGHGHKIQASLGRLVAKHEAEPSLTVALYVPEFDVRALAYVLELPAGTVATGLALKAHAALAKAHPVEKPVEKVPA